MKAKKAKVVNKLGLHARPAMQIVQTANRFQSRILIEKDGNRVEANSILDLLTLVAPPGTELTVIAEGPDEEEAVEAVVRLIESGFGEELVDDMGSI